MKGKALAANFTFTWLEIGVKNPVLLEMTWAIKVFSTAITWPAGSFVWMKWNNGAWNTRPLLRTVIQYQVMKKNINEGITSWSCTNFSKLESQELYGRQKSELLMRFQEWKGYWVKCYNYFFSISYRYHFDTFLFQNLPYSKIKFLWIKMHFRRYAAFSLEYSLIVSV